MVTDRQRDQGTRSPIELFWTAKNQIPKIVETATEISSSSIVMATVNLVVIVAKEAKSSEVNFVRLEVMIKVE